MLGERFLMLFMCLAVLLSAKGKVQNARTGEREDSVEARCEVEMSCVEGDGGVIEVSLGLECEAGICGALVDVEYNGDVFLLLSCGVDGEGLEISYADLGSAVRVLLDGAENCARGVSVRLYFARVEGSVSGGSFQVGRVEAYRFSDGGILCALAADIGVSEVEVGGVAKAESVGASLLELEAVRGADGEVTAVICGVVSGGYFAAGFKIFALELGSGASETVYVVGVIGGSRGGIFERRVALSLRGNLSLTVTPLAYDRGEMSVGEKRVFVLSK